MKSYIVPHPWKIIEEKFDKSLHLNSESLFSIGNGRMGQRANFEERYSGPSLRGSYIAGIYYPDKTRVGWWKNGYPEYFAKVLNSVNWIGVSVIIDKVELDLDQVKVLKFRRELDMRRGLLKRDCTVQMDGDKRVRIRSERFVSMANKNLAFMRYSVTLLNFGGRVRLEPYLDFNVRNADANYDEDFWKKRTEGEDGECSWVRAKTRKTNFDICAAACVRIEKSGGRKKLPKAFKSSGKVGYRIKTKLSKGQSLTIDKHVAIVSNLYEKSNRLVRRTIEQAKKSRAKGYDPGKISHQEVWAGLWQNCDIEIQGDKRAQQGIRFNIFQLLQTYTGDDARLNIGPKGFTGEKYGGSTYWDTEAYCLPFYMSTTGQDVARNLLIYRYKHLQKAIENAEKLGFDKGAALYPMVTMNGEECHNEWEITFEEIHRNGAIAYAIFDYIRYTADRDYLAEYGLEVLIAIARFWAQRVHVSPVKKQYVMHGVTGPNEYENNINNNWYTNYIASWSLKYTMESTDWVANNFPADYERIANKTKLDRKNEFALWNDIIEEIYFPVDSATGIFWQHEGYDDKEDLTFADIPPKDLPINQNWSWDRILRSPFIKQADVLQGLYFFEEDFDLETIRTNFAYYEPRTVHESSLSPCVHAVLAALLGDENKAYQMYLRTARLDLDDYNNDTEDGCHITSMAGTWLALVKGFAGMRVKDGHLSFNSFLPTTWDKLSFRILYRENKLQIEISKDSLRVVNLDGKEIEIDLFDQTHNIFPGESAFVEQSKSA